MNLRLIRRLFSPLKPAVRAVRFAVRMRRVRACLEELRHAVASDRVDLALMERLRSAWGNPGWTCDAGFLVELSGRMSDRPGPVLDCGSGLSTLVCAVSASRRGERVWSLEQNESWHREMTRVLAAVHADNVLLWHTPLKSYGDFQWFDLAGRALPPHFPVVSCDGPAVMRSGVLPVQYSSWRAGLVPVLREMGVSFGQVLLDDAEDPRAPGLIDCWRQLGLTVGVLDTPTGKLIVAESNEAPSHGVS